jgi:DNA-directed RNA polymerase subunit F
MGNLAAQPSQTTPIVTGTDIFAFGNADAAPGPGEEKTQEPATPAPAEDHPGEANENVTQTGTGKAEEPAAAPPVALRFKTHEDAERGYRELQGKATRAEQEAAEARRKIAEYEAQHAARQKQEIASAAQSAVDHAIDEYMTERTEKAVEEIEALDPDDPAHRKKVAQIYARRDSDVRKFTINPVGKDGKPIAPPSPEPSPSAVPEKEAGGERQQPASDPGTTYGYTAEADAPRAAAPAVPADEQVRREQVREYIDSRANAAAIDPNDELWVGVSLTTPTRDENGRSLSLDEQIEWTIERYKERKAAIQARARQASNLPMGEGGRVRSAPEGQAGGSAGGPIGLGDAIARANERRRL